MQLKGNTTIMVKEKNKMSKKSLRISMVLILASLIILIALPSVALANMTYYGKIPATGYEKSCSLCHTTAPALNAFGTKFKAAGSDFSKLTTSTTTNTTKPATTTTTTTKPATTTVNKPVVKPAPAPVGIKEGKFADMLTSIGYYSVADNADATLTREKAAVYLIKALGIANTAKDMPTAEAMVNLKAMKDAKDVKTVNLVAAAVKAGLFIGDKNSNLKPGDVVTERAANVLIARAKEKAPKIAALPNYVGTQTCKMCHESKFNNWKSTGHSRHVIDIRQPGALSVTFENNKYFTIDQALYAVGGITSLRFLTRAEDGDYYYLGGSWDIEGRKWLENASGPTTNWSVSCAGCHTAGYNKESKQFAERGITCESCHKPGLQHVLGGGDTSKITVSEGNEVCASCHGQDEQLESMGEQFKDENGVPKAGHANHFKEAVDNPNSALSNHYGDTCMKCHSVTAYRKNKPGKEIVVKLEDFKTGALKDDRMGITCIVCHGPHGRSRESQLSKDPYTTCIQCHTYDKDIVSGSAPHHPTKELMEGQYLVDGKLNKMPVAGHIDCADCHMAGGNHYFKPGTPTITLQSHGKDVVYEPCAKCHKTPDGTTTMGQERFDSVQSTYQARFNAITADWNLITTKKATLSTATLAKYNDDVANYGLLSADKSAGVHNPAFMSFMLDKLETDMKAFKAELGL